VEPLLARARETCCVVTKGLGPRYLHSTGQLHKGGPNTGLFIQVVDDQGDELPGLDEEGERRIQRSMSLIRNAVLNPSQSNAPTSWIDARKY
jgi:hypothetical protein